MFLHCLTFFNFNPERFYVYDGVSIKNQGATYLIQVYVENIR